MNTSAIEWTDVTWNPVTGCAKVSPGCAHCYMFALYPRLNAMGVPGYELTPDSVQVHRDRIDHPRRWRKPRRVFVNSMSDLFHEDVPDEFIVDVLEVCRETPQHTYQVLTKRPERMAEVLELHGYYQHGLPPNIWLGVSVENQYWADRRIPVLLDTLAQVRFLSCEPLLKSVDLTRYLDGIQWVIVGGESGPRARPMQAEWARAIRDDCESANVAFFFKQWGGATPKAAGRELDGRMHSEYPEVKQ